MTLTSIEDLVACPCLIALHLGQEISGYIDYAHRLATEDITPVFEGKKRFLPRPTDLSFLNWETMCVSGRESPHYKVMVLTSFSGRESPNDKVMVLTSFSGRESPNYKVMVLTTFSGRESPHYNSIR